MATIDITVGRLLCRPLRNYLEEMRFKGFDIEYIESSGFIERDFVIKGNDSAISIIDGDLKNWITELDRQERSRN